MAASDSLGEFVTAAKSKGLDDASIVALLKQNGWSERRIYAALSSYHEVEIGIPIPSRGGRTENARDAFFYLLAFVTLGIWSVALVFLADAIVDRMFPSALDNVYQDTQYFRETIAGQLASLIIAFPIYLFVSSGIVADTKARPESLESGVRKWLTYIALVIAAITLVGDGVWFLRTFLVGDLTGRFVVKAFALFIIAGGIFWYYLASMRDGARSSDRPFGIAATVAVVACLVIGFLGIGSPYYGRQLAFDLQRENDLRDLRYQVQDYWTKHKALPPDLTHPVDKENDQRYDYIKGAGPHYQLCATFDVPSSTADSVASNWTYHKTGRNCYTLDATVTT